MSTAAPDGGFAAEAEEKWLRDAFVQFVATQSTELRDEIAARTSWIATRSARRFSDRGEPFDDLVQVARIGLLKAIDRFDPERGVPFGAYATPSILGELRRHFRDHTWSTYVPRRTKDLRAAVNALSDELAEEFGQSRHIAQIATRLGVSEDAVIEALEANNAYRSFALDTATANHAASVDGGFDDFLNRDDVEGLLDRLGKRERRIIQLRYFDELTQAEIAAVIGTSQVHVGRLITSSLEALRRLPR